MARCAAAHCCGPLVALGLGSVKMYSGSCRVKFRILGHAEVPALFLETVRRTSARLFGSLWEARQVQPRCQNVRTAISLFVESTGSAVVPTCSHRDLSIC